MAWIWLHPAAVLAAHDEQIAEHGGIAGIRDAGLLGEALARPRHLDAGGMPDAATLAAAYACGIVRNRPFIDGNKRMSFVALELFLTLNGQLLAANDGDIVCVVSDLADGTLSEAELAGWVRQSMPRPDVMRAYEASHETFAPLYEKLGE